MSRDERKIGGVGPFLASAVRLCSAPGVAGAVVACLVLVPGGAAFASAANRSRAPGGGSPGPIVAPPSPPPGEVEQPSQACTHVSTRQELVDALAGGDRCVYVDDNAQIDLAAGDNRSGASAYEIHVPEGVTLEGGRSPSDPGGLLYMSHPVGEKVMLDLGADTRVSGLRLGGFARSGVPSQDGTTGIRIAGVDGVLVDNNDIFGWPGAAIEVVSTPNDRSTADRVRITDNFIHNNEGPELGYGVTVGDPTGYALIERNVFSHNRHDVAGDHSSPTAGYIARLNFVLEPGYVDPTCDKHKGCYGGHFDFHGSADPGHWVGGGAGQYIDIESNTIRGDRRHHFWQSLRPAFDIRGTPADRAVFADNVVEHPGEGSAMAVSGVCGSLCDDEGKLKDEHKLVVSGNTYDVTTADELTVGNFADDGCSDVFQANGTAWWYSPCGSGIWRFLQASTLRLGQLALGDFNGDGKTDVFTQSGDRWLVSYSGTGAWQALPATSNVAMTKYRFGDFDGDGKTDVFRTNGRRWYYSSGGRTAWIPLQTSSFAIGDLRFGDFNGDGKTDVFSLADRQWSVSYGGTSRWQRLNAELSSNLGELVFADFNGDGKTDIARSNGWTWQVSWGGATPWQALQTGLEPPLTGMLLGDFNGDGRADALQFRGLETYQLSSAGTSPLVPWSHQDMR